jgi:transposase
MKRFVEGEDCKQAILLPEYLEDYVSDDNPVRVVDVFVDELDLRDLGCDGSAPAMTGRPSYHPSVLLRIYIYGYLNRVQSSRRLERETQRNIELMWLTGRLSPDFKTIADLRRNNSKAIRNVCSQFTVLCGNLDLLSKSIVAIDGSKFKAVNACQYRDEPSCACIQPQARHGNPRHWGGDAIDTGLKIGLHQACHAGAQQGAQPPLLLAKRSKNR